MTKLSEFPKIKGTPDSFTGRATVQYINKMKTGETSVAMVIFEKGARSHWHTHVGEQTLFFLEGKGRVKIKGAKVMNAKPGDVFNIPAMKVHWHGSHYTENKRTKQLAITTGGINWMDPVSDEDYKAKK